MPVNLFDKKLNDLRISVFDLETTGLFPVSDRIIQIAELPVEISNLTVPSVSGDDATSWLVHPGAGVHIPEYILELTGLDRADILSAEDLTTVLLKFKDRVGKNIVAGHNVKQFDLKFLKRAELRTGIDLQTDYYIDTLKIARILHPDQPSHKLSDCAEFYKIEFPKETQHNALYDTIATANVLLNQIVELKDHGVISFGDLISFLS